jgi:uncharacterized protein (TIGR03086 family)
MSSPSTQIGALAAAAFDQFIAAVEQIAPDSWNRPSNLEGWSVRELVGHATGSAAKVVTLVEGGELWTGPSEPADWVCEDPPARLRELATRLQAALPAADLSATRVSPAGEVPLHQALAFPVADLAMHSWDIFRSVCRPLELSDPLLTMCRRLVESVPQDVLRRPSAFGPAQPAPENASPTTRMMAYLGRSVDGVSSG